MRRVAAADASVGSHPRRPPERGRAPGSRRRSRRCATPSWPRWKLALACSGTWGADPGPGEGRAGAPSSRPRAGAVLRGAKTFCSGAGGVDAALVVVGDDDGRAPRLGSGRVRRDFAVDRDWYRGAGCGPPRATGSTFATRPSSASSASRASSGASPGSRATRCAPPPAGPGWSTPPPTAALAELAARRAGEPLSQLAAGRIEAARGTVDAWLARPPRRPTRRRELKPLSVLMRAEIDRAAKTLLEAAAAACGSHPFVTGRPARSRPPRPRDLPPPAPPRPAAGAARRGRGSKRGDERRDARPSGPRSSTSSASPEQSERPLGLRDQRLRAGEVPRARWRRCRDAPAARSSWVARSASSRRCSRPAASSLLAVDFSPTALAARAAAAGRATENVEAAPGAPAGADAGGTVRDDRLLRDPLLLEPALVARGAAPGWKPALAPGGTLRRGPLAAATRAASSTATTSTAILRRHRSCAGTTRRAEPDYLLDRWSGGDERRGDRDRRRRPGRAGGGQCLSRGRRPRAR